MILLLLTLLHPGHGDQTVHGRRGRSRRGTPRRRPGLALTRIKAQGSGVAARVHTGRTTKTAAVGGGTRQVNKVAVGGARPPKVRTTNAQLAAVRVEGRRRRR